MTVRYFLAACAALFAAALPAPAAADLARDFEEHRRRIEPLRRDAERWIAAAEALESKYAASPAVAGLAQEIHAAYGRLAAEARFAHKQPERAIAVYEKSLRRARPGTGQPLIEFQIGDIYQFDLRAPGKALQRYQAALSRIALLEKQAGAMEKGLLVPWQRMLQHEIAFLRSGRKFTGALAKQDVGGFLGIAFFFGAGDALGAPRLAQGASLDGLPASRLNLLASSTELSASADPAAILRYLAKHDPSGYWSACLLSIPAYLEAMQKTTRDERSISQVQAMRQQFERGGLRRAAEQFARERNVALSLPAPDPRLSSPEKTWQLFIDALGRGDLDTAYACFTPGMKAKMEPAFSRMAPPALKGMAESFEGFALSQAAGDGRFREAVVKRGERIGLIYFLELEGEWKIDEM